MTKAITAMALATALAAAMSSPASASWKHSWNKFWAPLGKEECWKQTFKGKKDCESN